MELRKGKNMTQSDLAEVLSYSDKTVSKGSAFNTGLNGKNLPQSLYGLQMTVDISYFFKRKAKGLQCLTA